MQTMKVSVGLALFGAALRVAALTIGATQGTVWIGQPLDVSVLVRRDVSSPATDLCADAVVGFGESAQDGASVQITQEATEQVDAIRLRVRSSTRVNEPIVNVTVRVGCEQKFERRFVLLADLPQEPLVPMVVEIPAEPVSAPLTTPLSTLMPTPMPPRAPAASAATRASARRTSTEKIKRPNRTPADAAVAAKPSISHGSRLTLDPLEVLTERIKTLEANAAAAPVESVSQDAKRVQQLESELQGLRLQTGTNEVALLSMRKRLERAESERVSAEWFYGLIGILVLCVFAIVMLWQRRRTPPATPQAERDEPEPYEAQFLRPTLDAEKREPPPVFEPPVVRKPAPKKPSQVPVDVDLLEMNDSQWSDFPVRRM